MVSRFLGYSGDVGAEQAGRMIRTNDLQTTTVVKLSLDPVPAPGGRNFPHPHK
jgi:hypothetical protein